MLTNKQIESLFTFCEKHFVKYYDVQVELVDHLANAVEEKMAADSTLTFEKALEKGHQSFGVRGFAPLVSEKQAAAEKQSRKLFWQLLKSHFGWPKILTFFVLLSVLFTVFSFDPSSINKISVGILIICWPIFIIGILKLQRKVARTGKKFMMISLSWISSLLFLPVYFINISNVFSIFYKPGAFNYTQDGWIVYGVSVFLSLYIVAIIALWQTLISVKKSLYQAYPEVFSTIA